MQNLQDYIQDMARLIRQAHYQIPGPKFLAEYSILLSKLFPGGTSKTFEKIRAGDGPAIELGLVFLEVQPYFFRSQYIRTKLMRLLKHARLSASQAERLSSVLALEHEKKMKRRS